MCLGCCVEAVGERRCDLLVVEASVFSRVFGHGAFQLRRRSQELCYGIAIGRSSGVHSSVEACLVRGLRWQGDDGDQGRGTGGHESECVLREERSAGDTEFSGPASRRQERLAFCSGDQIDAASCIGCHGD